MNQIIPPVTLHRKSIANAVRLINEATGKTYPIPTTINHQTIGNLFTQLNADYPDVPGQVRPYRNDINSAFAILDPILVSGMAMVITMRTAGAAETVTLPLTGTHDVTIDWGDGSVDENVTAVGPTHEYADAGDYDISISGSADNFSFADENHSKDKVTHIVQWGDIGVTDWWWCFGNVTA